MTIRELILKNRSYRRFHAEQSIDRQTLVELVDLARHSASGSNQQPLKFFLSADPGTNALIFPNTRWAGYLEDWPGPSEGERPAAYIVVLGDKNITENFGVDHGIAAQSILLGATERGLGGCIIGSVQRVKLHRELGLADHLHILLVIALGKPKETVVVETVGADGDIKYWRDEAGIHHVPKRGLDDLIVN
ncbi:MAG: nitroreductase family protein [Anaerolineales bacterium]